jgi:hypothetical protein
MRPGFIRALRPAALILAAAAMLAVAAPASAQQDPLSGFFRALFGGGRQQTQPAAPPGVVPGAPPATAVKPRPAEPKVTEQPKDPNAQVVAVIGDWQTANLAAGLQAAFAETPNVVVSRRIRSGMGLVRDGDFDLFGQTPALIADGRADILVVMLGINDRVTFPASGGQRPDEVRSEKWEAAYRDRALRFGKLLRDTGKPVFWVGQAPVERPQLNGFLDYANGVAKAAAEANGIAFVDVWNGFTDDEGEFTAFGADVDGRERRLRADDGISFTRTGQRKLAYFVEQEIRAIIRDGPTPEPLTPEAPTTPQVREEAMLAAPPPLPPAPWKRVWPAQPLGDKAGTTDTDLAGAPPPLARPGQTLTPASAATVAAAKPAAAVLPGGYPVAETPYARRIVRGEEIEAAPGRADDFRYDRAGAGRGP